MRLVMTLLVRDEEDTIEANLEHHLAQGVDHVLVTDNGSRDATVSILERYVRRGLVTLIHEPSDDFSQHRWVTRMARLAATDHAAQWVLHNDADEFWFGRNGDLRSTLARFPESVGVVVAHRYDVVPVSGPADEPFWRRMTVRHVTSANEDGAPLPPKVLHRAHPDVVVTQGNHDVHAEGLGTWCDDGSIEILHFPKRSLGQFVTKIRNGGAAYERNTDLDASTGHRWRRLHALDDDALAADYHRSVRSDAQLRAGIERGDLVADHRLRDELTARGRVSTATRLVLVTGMHRSGTSLTTMLLGELGLSLGDPDALIGAAPDNPHGFFEHRPLVDLDDRLLALLGGSWDRPPLLVPGWEQEPALDPLLAEARELIAGLRGWSRGPVAGGKDPRLSLLLPFWRRAAPGATTVVVVRHPLEVAASLRRRNQMPPERACGLWLRHVLAARSSAPDAVVVRWDSVFDDLEGTLAVLARRVLDVEAPDLATVERIRARIDRPGHRRPTPDGPGTPDPLTVAATAVWDDGAIRVEALDPAFRRALAEGWLATVAGDDELALARAQVVELTDRLRRRVPGGAPIRELGSARLEREGANGTLADDR